MMYMDGFSLEMKLKVFASRLEIKFDVLVSSLEMNLKEIGFSLMKLKEVFKWLRLINNEGILKSFHYGGDNVKERGHSFKHKIDNFGRKNFLKFVTDIFSYSG